MSDTAGKATLGERGDTVMHGRGLGRADHGGCLMLDPSHIDPSSDHASDYSLDTRNISSFLVLAEELHFGRAASRLRISQPRLSQIIKAMERQIGSPLFLRSSRQVALTPLGKRLHQDVERPFQHLLAAVGKARNTARGTDGILRLGFLGSAANELTSDIVSAFRDRHPECEIRMVETHLADPLGPLQRGEVDMAMTRLPVSEPGLAVGPVIVSESRVLAVPAGCFLARHTSVRWEDIALGTSFAAAPPAPEHWWDSQIPPVTPLGREVRRRLTVATLQELLSHISAGHGIAPLAASAARYYARPDIVYVPIEDAPLSEVALVWRSEGVPARVQAFTDTACEVLRFQGGRAVTDTADVSCLSSTHDGVL